MYRNIKTELYSKYVKEVIPRLQKDLKLKNIYTIPRIDKVIVNMGLKQAKGDKAVLEEALGELAVIAGQKPIVTKAKKSISNFALREGNPIGCKVTLRGKFMYEFLERLLRIALPRVRDFSGIKRSFDRFGNLTIGIVDESIFPEVDMDKIKSTKGMSVTVVTSLNDREKSIKVFELLGFPLVNE